MEQPHPLLVAFLIALFLAQNPGVRHLDTTDAAL